MAIYDAGAASLRDTVKWMVAFVPIAGVIAPIAVLGPRLVDSATDHATWGNWWAANWGVAVGILAVAIGVGLIIWQGAAVLTTEPTDFTAFMADDARMALAFGMGVGSPQYATLGEFQNALSSLSAGLPVEEAAAVGATTATATATLREWVWFADVKHRFHLFTAAFAAGGLLIVTGVIVAASTIEPASGSIEQPTTVIVEVSTSGSVALEADTGCTDPGKSTFTAVAGSWARPILAVDGAGCEFAARWQPSPSQAEIRPAPDVGP